MRSPAHLLTAITELVSLRTDPGPMLFGVDTSAPALRLHPIPLDPLNPLTDISCLVAPTEWDIIVVSCDAFLRRSHGRASHAVTPARVTHGVSRSGHTSTRTQPPVASGTLSTICGPLHDACEQVLADVARVVP